MSVVALASRNDVRKNISQRSALSIAECSKESGLSQNFLRNDPSLPKRKFGRRVLVLANDWMKYLESGSAGTKAEAA
jgi:hypothetical protein